MRLTRFAKGILASAVSFGVISSVTNRCKESDTIVNWSGTHSCKPSFVHTPSTLKDLEEIVARSHQNGTKLRSVGTALSPNGVAFNEDGNELVNLVLMDKIISIDIAKKRVRVEAGARVSMLVEALRPHGLTLQNYASISEQQLGGLYQVGAHGTGITIPPADAQVVAMTIVTPGRGTLRLSADDADPEQRKLFYLARLGLGCLGVVSDVTVECVDAHMLLEETRVLTRAEVVKGHRERLRASRHVRYMWIPYTDSVVVVSSNPSNEKKNLQVDNSSGDALAPMKNFIGSLEPTKIQHLGGKSLADLRDIALEISSVDPALVAKVNRAEAEVWRMSQGERLGWSDQILNFDCGGQQWVSEVAFPVHSGERDEDIEFMVELLGHIEKKNIPAPSPIEQRWTSSSLSPLSPAHTPTQTPTQAQTPLAPAAVFSWVGIIMYLPLENPEKRARISDWFRRYRRMCAEDLWVKYSAVEHWAKVEMPTKDELAKCRQRIQRRCDVAYFNKMQRELDPKGILGNDLLNKILSD